MATTLPYVPDLLTVTKGALAYLEALPLSARPDETWLAPLRQAIANAEESS